LLEKKDPNNMTPQLIATARKEDRQCRLKGHCFLKVTISGQIVCIQADKAHKIDIYGS